MNASISRRSDDRPLASIRVAHRARDPLWSSYKCADERWIYFVMIQSDRHWPDFCRALANLNGWTIHASRTRRSCAKLRDAHRRNRSRRRRSNGTKRRGFLIVTISSGCPSAPTPRCSTIRRPTPSALLPRSISPKHRRMPRREQPGQFGDAPSQPHRAAPELGQHTEEVALEMGLTWDEIASLKASGRLG